MKAFDKKKKGTEALTFKRNFNFLNETETKKVKIIFKIDPKLNNFGVNKVYTLRNFIKYCIKFLQIKGDYFQINLRNGKDEHLETLASYGYSQNNDEPDNIYLRAGGRHIVDIMRSLAHELTHKRQNERGELTDDSGVTGSEQENEANSFAGVIMRNYTKLNPDILEII